MLDSGYICTDHVLLVVQVVFHRFLKFSFVTKGCEMLDRKRSGILITVRVTR